MSETTERKKKDYAILKTLPVPIRLEINRLMRKQLAESIIHTDKQRIKEEMYRFSQSKNKEERRRLAKLIVDRRHEITAQHIELKRIERQSLEKNPRTSRQLPQQLDRRLASLSRRDERIQKFATKVRSDILVMYGNRTPCKSWGAIDKPGIASIEEALYALAVGHQDAGLGGDGTTKLKLKIGQPLKQITNEGNPDSPWEGHVTTKVNQGSNCAFNIANIILAFARNPDNIENVITKYREENNVRIAGTISVAYRIIYRKKTKEGNVVERYEAPQLFRTRTFTLGVAIRKRKQ